MAAWYKPTLRAEHVESGGGLLCGRSGLRHELDDVAGLQGNVHSAQQLAGLHAIRDTVVHNDDLARVFGTVVIGGHHGLGQRHTLGPGDEAVADFAIDGDAGCLSLLHAGGGLLLPRHEGGARPGVGLALGNTAAKEDSEQQDAQTDWTGLKHPTTNIQHRTSKDCYLRKHWMLDVGCSLLDVPHGRHEKDGDLRTRTLVGCFTHCCNHGYSQFTGPLENLPELALPRLNLNSARRFSLLRV